MQPIFDMFKVNVTRHNFHLEFVRPNEFKYALKAFLTNF